MPPAEPPDDMPPDVASAPDALMVNAPPTSRIGRKYRIAHPPTLLHDISPAVIVVRDLVVAVM